MMAAPSTMLASGSPGASTSYTTPWTTPQVDARLSWAWSIMDEVRQAR